MSENKIHKMVEGAYTDALARAQRAGSGGCCSGPEKAAANLGGYQPESVDADLLSTSFGCGNPLALAGVEPGDVVLDLGSGAGLDLLIASEKVGSTGRVIGVDMTDAMIEAARANAAKAGLTNIEVRKGLIEELPVESNSVDWVISNCVLNLSPDKERVFAEIARVLKPGGRISISDIVVEDLPDWIRTASAAYTACVAGAITEAEYIRGLTAAGLVDVSVVERLVYDADQLRGIVASDLPQAESARGLVDRALAEVVGKVASIRVVAAAPVR